MNKGGAAQDMRTGGPDTPLARRDISKRHV
jgi:hypothetical protein